MVHDGLEDESLVLLEQIRTIDKRCKFGIRTFAAECVSSHNKYVMVDSHQCTLKISYSASRRNFILREEIADEKSLHIIQSFYKETGKYQ